MKKKIVLRVLCDNRKILVGWLDFHGSESAIHRVHGPAVVEYYWQRAEYRHYINGIIQHYPYCSP